MPRLRPSAVVLLSGGLDSATALAFAVSEGLACHALSFRYGQRHAVELEAAARVAQSLGAAEHRVLDLPIAQFGGSALTDPDIEVPLDRDIDKSIPVTYVPARNTIFLAFALALGGGDGLGRRLHRRQRARLQRLSGLPAGVRRGVPALAALATRRAVEGRAPRIGRPLIDMTKADIIRAAPRWAWTTR